jgi:hypothetical protein
MMISWFKTLNARPPVATSLPVRAFQPGLEIWFSLLILLLLVAALIRYYPLWSENHVKPYGLIEGDNRRGSPLAGTASGAICNARKRFSQRCDV